MTTVERLQEWFVNQCNGDWEHDDGIAISTLDNPGWSVDINLTGTSLEARPFTAIVDLRKPLKIPHHRHKLLSIFTTAITEQNLPFTPFLGCHVIASCFNPAPKPVQSATDER